MEINETSPNVQTDRAKASSSNPVRFFYSGAAILLLILAFIGFQHFYLHGRNFENQELDADRRGLLIVHGIAMTAWMLLFVVQTLLIVSGNRRFHRILGWVSASVALCVVALGAQLVFPLPLAGQTENLFYGLTPDNSTGSSCSRLSSSLPL